MQNPKVLTAKTYVVVQQHEIDDDAAPGGLRSIFVKRQCMHCEDPACVAACPVTAMFKTEEGPVTYDVAKCIGCRYCVLACPWDVPTAEWDSLAPRIGKCDGCYSRTIQALPTERNGTSRPAEASYATIMAEPECVKQCAPGALLFGDRDKMLAEAKRRIHEHPDKYVDYIYGEHEAGGTNTLYLAAVPFDQLGFPTVQKTALPHYSGIALGSVPPAIVGVGAILGGCYAFSKRRLAVAAAEGHVFAEPETPILRTPRVKPPTPAPHEAHHLEFAPIPFRLWTKSNILLTALMAFGALSFVLRFVLGIGAATNLSNTYAWGLWIYLDLIWIAVAAGAFATAGIVYVFQRKDLYSMGRTAVLMGFLSYSFVLITLLADLGLPWHFYSLGLNHPRDSAMFEVSWCVGLYVSILLLEFLPVPFQHFGLNRYADLWKKYAPIYVVFAIPFFVYVLSHKLLWTALALIVFGTMAYAFRSKPGEKPVPIMLAIAAVTLSTMHQSSLGSLFLLMPDKLNHLWWSPMMPVFFFLSSIAAGTALMVLIEMWIAKAWHRTLQISQVAGMGQIAFWAMLIYQVARLGDLVYRGEFHNGGSKTGLFLVEVVLGGLLPLILLSSNKLRSNPRILALGSVLAVAGIVLNRLNVGAFGMTLRGAMPQTSPVHYFPSIFEWGVSAGLIAATIFLFGLGVRYLPVLPVEENR
jgi:formate dehydrogenase iron-sulfur subunit